MQPALSRFLAGLMSRSGGEVACFDLDRRYTFVSDALAKVNGIPAAEHLGRTLDEVLPDIAPQIRPFFAAACSGEVVTHETRGRTANAALGERVWLEHWFPVYDEDDATVIGVGVSIADVTELRRAEERAAAHATRQKVLADFAQRALDQETTLQALFEQAVADMAGVLRLPLSRVVRVVAGSDDLEFAAGVGWGDDPSPIPGPRSHSYTDFIMSAREPVRIEDLATERRFRIPATLSARGVRSSIACGLRGPRGPWGLISGHSLELRPFTDDECAFVQELANSLSLAVAVKEAQELQRDTISIASHELRTPLTSVIGLGQHLTRRLTRSGAEESTIEMTQSLTAEAFRLNAILDRWMGFAELQSGLADHAIEHVDLRECVSRQAGSARERHGRMTVVVEVPDEPVELDTAPSKVAGVLDNLLENAARYAGEEARVVVTLLAEADRVFLSVRDNGPGVAPEHQAHLFERFYRGEGRIKGGLGVGLYVSRALAEELGGMLTVESTPGEGATFTLEVPRRAPGRGPGTPAATDTPTSPDR